MATSDHPPSITSYLHTSNMMADKNLFAKVSQRMGLLPTTTKGLNDIKSVAEDSTQTKGSGSPLDVVRREAEVIAEDVIINFGRDDRKPPNKFCKTMRRTVKELSSRHDIAFKGMVNKLNLESNNPFQTFNNVADEIYDDGQINWGRIVAVYAFAARLANDKGTNTDFPKKIALFVGKYVGNKLGQWIVDNGGWVSVTAFVYIIDLCLYGEVLTITVSLTSKLLIFNQRVKSL